MSYRRLLVRSAVVAAVTATVAGLLPATAQAGGPGVWTNLSGNPSGGFPKMGNIDEPSVARFGSDLQVAWRVRASGRSEEYRTRVVRANGAYGSGVLPLLTGWDGLIENPRLLSVGGQRTLVFSGLRSGDAADPYTKGSAYVATSSDGAAWTLASGSISKTQSVYAAYGNDAVDDGGTPVWVGNAGSTNGIRWHRGLEPTIPAGSEDASYNLSGCCAYDAAVVRDRVTGEVFAAFHSNSSNPDEKGVQVGRILPTVGFVGRAPLSAVAYDGRIETPGSDQRIAMAARVGGGVWVAYKQGYPTTRAVRLFNAQTGRSLAVPGSANASHIALAAAPGGRLWVMWLDRATETVRAVRSNPGVTAFGALRVIRRPAGQDRLWHTTGDAANGPLDLVVTAEAGSAINAYHQQVQPGLSLAFGRRVVVTRSGVRLYPVVVTDAGVPVRNATIRLGRSVVATTGRTGAAYVPIGRAARGTFGVSAAKAGYFPASASLRVR